jgi:branched-chain amino acid transport system permease protein
MLSYLVAIGTFVGIYAIAALGLNLQWGMTGLVNLAQVGFMAIGAYSSALLTLAGVPFLLAACVAPLLAALGSLFLVFVTPRLREDYLSIVTLGLSETLRLVILNSNFTGGEVGLSAIPQPFRGETVLPYQMLYAIIVVVALLLVLVVFEGIARSPMGRVLRAIREDEIVPAVLGKPVMRFKAEALILGAAAAGLAGCLYAHYLTYIAPDLFTVEVSLLIFIAVIIAKRGSNVGAIVGAVGIVALQEGTRFLKDSIPVITGVQLASLRLIIIGIALIMLVLLRPAAFGRER